MTEPYDIHNDIKFAPLELVDVGALARSVEPWFNQTLCKVNECVVRVGIVHGDFHWHHHDDEDEFFYVIEGKWVIDLKDPDRSVELGPGQGFVVPRGVEHKTRAPVRTVILMVEGAGVQATGD